MFKQMISTPQENYDILKEKEFEGLLFLGEKVFTLTFNHYLAEEDYLKCAFLQKLENKWLENREANVKEHFKLHIEPLKTDVMGLIMLSMELSQMSKGNLSISNIDGTIKVNGETDLETFLIEKTLSHSYERDGLNG